MSEPVTVRERIRRASAFFRVLDAAVLTTFNLSAAFLEDHALPAALGVEGKTAAARRADLHRRLGATPCTVYYDPHSAPRLTGRFRYVARPVPLRGRFFHPKLVILAGRSADDVAWVYLAVSSANLTMSGWGRNAESFGETWIHTQKQPTWKALDELLRWLQRHAALGERRARSDATARVRDVLADMPERKRFSDDGAQPWSGSLRARLYSSVVDRDGLAAFLRQRRSRKPDELWAYSPYWSEVRERVEAFGAKETSLVPARRRDGASLGLSREQAEAVRDVAAIRRNPGDVGARFFHMKAYWIRYGERTYTAVGSCNFTRAGLVGAAGNVEAMLVFKADPDWLPAGEDAPDAALADDALAEEEAPEPAPVAIVVAWDWRAHAWRWWLDAARGQRDFALEVPGLAVFSIQPGKGNKRGTPPPRGAAFTVTYRVGDDEYTWRGNVVELNLDHSARTYGRSLTANEILDSWRGVPPPGGDDEDDEDNEDGADGDGGARDQQGDTSDNALAAFDAVNLYELYRATRALRARLAGLDAHPDLRRGYLVGRFDSAMTLALLANRDGPAPVVRYLVLRELVGVIKPWAALLDRDLVARVAEMADKARARTREHLVRELGRDADKADAMLDWFERQLAGLDREVAA